MNSGVEKGTYNDLIVQKSIDKWGLASDDSVYISTILVGRVANFVNQVIELTTTKTRSMFLRSDINYTEAKHRFEYEEEAVKNLNPKSERLQISNALYLQMVTPYTQNGKRVDDKIIKSRLNQIKGLLSAHFGLNVLFYELQPEIRKLSTPEKASLFMEPLLIDPTPVDLNRSNVLEFMDIIKKIDTLDENDRKPILLSVQFYLDGLRDFKIAMLPQAFLKLWVSIEGISMSGLTNIMALNRKLMSHYKISDTTETKSKFFTGKLFRLRSLIFHRAELPKINPRVIDLMIHLYYDLLCIITKSTVKDRTIKYLDSKIENKKMSEYLNEWFQAIAQIEESYKKKTENKKLN